MSFSERLTPLRQVNTGQLDALLTDFTKEVSKSCLPIPELDRIESLLKNLTVTSEQSGLLSFVSRTVTVVETDPYKHFLQAKEQEIDRASCASSTCQAESLRYLVAINDLVRFARYFRAIYLPGKGATDRQASDQALQQAINETAQNLSQCRWIQRVKEDFDWPCSLVPVLELAPFPKYLDLKDCDLMSIKAVIHSHVRQKYTALKISLNCSQQELIMLAKEGHLNQATELDLRQCPQLKWHSIQSWLGQLSQLVQLENLQLPMTIEVPDELFWDLSWREPVKSRLKPTLERIQAKARAESDFTYITHLMKGIQGKNRLSRESRIPVSFLLSRSSLLANLPPLQVLSASGIQSATAKDIVQARFVHNELYMGICYCPRLTKDDLLQLFTKFKVTKLFLRGCSQIDDSFFADLPKSYDVMLLRIDATSVTQTMFEALHFKFPAAEIVWDRHYLKNRAKIADSFGLDRHNLSDSAIEAIKHLKYTGYFPMISLETAMELLESDCRVLAQAEVIQKLKEFCRYILHLNVNRQTVRTLFLFAEKMNEWTLLYICKSFVQTLYCPDIPEQMSELTEDEKAAFSSIAKAKVADELQLTFTEDILYFNYDPNQVHFTAAAAPLYEQIQYDDVFNFFHRFAAAEPQKRPHYLIRLCQLFPTCNWLQAVAKRPEMILTLATARVADLRGFKPAVAVKIIKAFEKDKIELILDCSDADFDSIMCQIRRECITLLDLEACPRLSWRLIETHIFSMSNLSFVLLPKTFRETNPQAKPSINWSAEWRYCLSVNINHNIHQDEPSFPKGAQIERAWYHRLYDALFHKLAYSPHIINLGYYSKVSKEKVEASFANPHIEKIALFGASNVDDTFFPETLPPALKALDLRGTSVSKEKVQALRNANIAVEYDDDYLASQVLWQKMRNVNFTKLSQVAFDALSYFNITGYFPLLDERVAMELISCEEKLAATWRLKLVQEHCLKFLVVQIDRSNVRAIYNFAIKINDDLLKFLTYYFVEVHYNPYRQSDLTEGEHAFWKMHCRLGPTKFCDKKLEFSFEKKSPLKISREGQNASQAASANFNNATAEDQDGL